ncbi:MAG: cytochrome P450 [Proteobacteria bacterium]|nr:cytochrome P450 [Pseudomonadota bacterium]
MLPASRAKTPHQVSGGLPYVGHVVEFGRQPIELMMRGFREHGEIFNLSLAGRTATVLIGPEANEVFFTAPESQLSPREVYRMTVPIFGRGIAYDAEPEVMREQLGFLMPALREEKLHGYAEQMAAETLEHLATWAEEGVVDLVDACTEVTTAISSRCLLGREFREHLSAEISTLYREMERALSPLAFFAPYLPIPLFRRRDQARARMVELIERIIAERRARRAEEDDFLQALMTARYQDGRALTEDEISGLLLTVLFAGHRTSAALAAWTGVLLLQHAHHLPALLEEQLAVHGDDGAISFASLQRLPLLEQVVLEAGRLRPPLVLLMRNVLQDIAYKQYLVPAGQLLVVSPAVSHRDPMTFTDPERFDPERFAAPRQEDQRPFSLITWGGGRHACLGKHFALMQVKALWSLWLRAFEFALLDEHPAPDGPGLVVGPQRPARVHYRRRRRPLSEVVGSD